MARPTGHHHRRRPIADGRILLHTLTGSSRQRVVQAWAWRVVQAWAWLIPDFEDLGTLCARERPSDRAARTAVVSADGVEVGKLEPRAGGSSSMSSCASAGSGVCSSSRSSSRVSCGSPSTSCATGPGRRSQTAWPNGRACRRRSRLRVCRSACGSSTTVRVRSAVRATVQGKHGARCARRRRVVRLHRGRSQRDARRALEPRPGRRRRVSPRARNAASVPLGCWLSGVDGILPEARRHAATSAAATRSGPPTSLTAEKAS